MAEDATPRTAQMNLTHVVIALLLGASGGGGVSSALGDGTANEVSLLRAAIMPKLEAIGKDIGGHEKRIANNEASLIEIAKRLTKLEPR